MQPYSVHTTKFINLWNLSTEHPLRNKYTPSNTIKSRYHSTIRNAIIKLTSCERL